MTQHRKTCPAMDYRLVKSDVWKEAEKRLSLDVDRIIRAFGSFTSFTAGTNACFVDLAKEFREQAKVLATTFSLPPEETLNRLVEATLDEGHKAAASSHRHPKLVANFFASYSFAKDIDEGLYARVKAMEDHSYPHVPDGEDRIRDLLRMGME